MNNEDSTIEETNLEKKEEKDENKSDTPNFATNECIDSAEVVIDIHNLTDQISQENNTKTNKKSI